MTPSPDDAPTDSPVVVGGRPDAPPAPPAPAATPSWALPIPVPTLAERLIEEMVAWRTSLRIGLASLMTIAVVAAFWLVATPDDNGSADLSLSARAAGDGSAGKSTDGPLGPVEQQSDDEATDQTATTAARGRQGLPTERPRPSGGIEPSTTGGRASAPNAEPLPSPTSPSTDPIVITTTTVATSIASAPTTTTAKPASTTSSTPATSTSSTMTTPASTTSEPSPSTTTTTAVTTTTAADPAATTSSSGPAPITVRVEAETGRLLGTATARADHEGFSGSGFVGDIINEGSGVELSLAAPAAGPSQFTVRYAAGNNGPAELRTLTVEVNGLIVTTAEMQVTASWSDWSVVTGQLDLPAGVNTITLLWAPGDTGWVNIDYIQIN